MTFTIKSVADPDAAYMPIWAPLLQFNQQTVGDAQGVPFALTISAEGSDTVAGGLWGLSLWSSFYIGLVVTPEAARGTGLGTELMRQAEAEARARGCQHMWLDTYDFQARPFYEQLGFRVFGQIDGPAPMFPRYFREKRLEPLS
jgi:GNAT superfamily N-acetyltransferase